MITLCPSYEEYILKPLKSLKDVEIMKYDLVIEFGKIRCSCFKIYKRSLFLLFAALYTLIFHSGTIFVICVIHVRNMHADAC